MQDVISIAEDAEVYLEGYGNISDIFIC